ncbi:hypothetical protein XENTR_v10009311 [Xenopus tropicalis]|nr:hypothetical protein XENTR_v10009311 [Xenopus tropicalis]
MLLGHKVVLFVINRGYTRYSICAGLGTLLPSLTIICNSEFTEEVCITNTNGTSVFWLPLLDVRVRPYIKVGVRKRII